MKEGDDQVEKEREDFLGRGGSIYNSLEMKMLEQFGVGRVSSVDRKPEQIGSSTTFVETLPCHL